MNLKNFYLQENNVLQDYFDTSDELFIQIDQFLVITDVNLSVCRLRNMQISELKEQDLLTLVSPEDIAKVKKYVTSAFKDEEVDTFFKINLLDFNSKSQNFAVRCYLIKDVGDENSGLLLKFSPFVNRRRDSVMDEIYKSLSEIYSVIVVDEKGDIKHINQAVTNILGYSMDDLLGKNIVSLYDSSSENMKIREEMVKKIDSGENFIGEMMQLSKTGEKIPIQLSVSSIIHEDKVIGRLGVGRDLREEKKLQNENKSYALKIQGQAKLAEFGRMIQGVAHNLNTPLTGIKSSAQLDSLKIEKLKGRFLEKYGEEDLETIKMIDSLEKSSKMISLSGTKMKRIIDNMMQKSRMEQSVDKVQLDLKAIMEQEIEFLMSSMFFKHEVEKHFEFDREIPKIYGLYSDFSQIFVNLIKNALDAMYNIERKILTIGIKAQKSNIIVSIKDSGHGISNDIKEKIFEPFFTTKPIIGEAEGDEPVGTGIGLENVKYTLDGYNSKISVESKVGKGTKFTIKIPIKKNQKKDDK